jgi:uncharacterized protein YjbI with pentapeptide repeats
MPQRARTHAVVALESAKNRQETASFMSYGRRPPRLKNLHGARHREANRERACPATPLDGANAGRTVRIGHVSNRPVSGARHRTVLLVGTKPPLEPYPPDLDEERREPEGIAGLADAVVDDVDWANVRAPRASVTRAVLRTVRLTGAELAEATLRDVTFADCRLDMVGLRLARLERVVFRDCRMEEADLYGARLKDVLFEGCTLREATLSGATLERCELRGCDLTGLLGAEALAGARMPWNDVLENAPLFAAALGIEIVD